MEVNKRITTKAMTILCYVEEIKLIDFHVDVFGYLFPGWDVYVVGKQEFDLLSCPPHVVDTALDMVCQKCRICFLKGFLVTGVSDKSVVEGKLACFLTAIIDDFEAVAGF